MIMRVNVISDRLRKPKSKAHQTSAVLSMGATALNLGCGAVVAPGWSNIDNSPSARLAKHSWLRWLLWKARILPDKYYRMHWPESILVRDLRKALPFPDNYADYVYTSHFLEHLTDTDAQRLLRDIYRVLKEGGIVRIVVPDLALGARQYLEALQANPADATAAPNFLNWMQIRRPGVRDPHLWMYDAPTLHTTLTQLGFSNVMVCEYKHGRVPDIDILDARPQDSLHVEAEKPRRDDKR